MFAVFTDSQTSILVTGAASLLSSSSVITFFVVELHSLDLQVVVEDPPA